MTDAPYVPPGQPGPQQPSPMSGPPMSDPRFADPRLADPRLAGPLAPPAPPERVGRGTLFALAALPVGMILAALIWQAGFIASLSTFAMAALIPFLYQKGSGGGLRRGIGVIIGLILLGTVLSFFAMVSSDLFTTYRAFSQTERASYGTLPEFWSSNIAYGPVLASYGKDAALFALFALLGGAGVVIRLLRALRASGR